MPSHLLSMGFTYLGCFSKAILAGGLAWSTTRFGKDLLKQKSTNLNVYMRNDLYRLICPSFRTSNCMYIRQCVCLTFKQQKDHVYNNEVRTEDWGKRSVHVFIQLFCISKKALMLLLASFEDFLVQEPVPSIEICIWKSEYGTLSRKPKAESRRMGLQKDRRRIAKGWQSDSRRINLSCYLLDLLLPSVCNLFAIHLISFCDPRIFGLRILKVTKATIKNCKNVSSFTQLWVQAWCNIIYSLYTFLCICITISCSNCLDLLLEIRLLTRLWQKYKPDSIQGWHKTAFFHVSLMLQHILK